MPRFKLPITIVLATVLLAAFMLPVLAATYNSGVTSGQFVKYSNFVATGPGFEAFNDYDYLTLQVTNVAGKEVTLLSTGQFKNGTSIPGNGTSTVWNVEAGTEDGTPSTQGPIIPANLNAGDPIPPPNTYTVNSTENREYLGFTRSINILEVTISTPDYNSTLTYVYDRASGMLLESTSHTTAQGQTEPVTTDFSYSITETNIFNSTPTNSTRGVPIEYILVAIVAALVIIAVVVLLFRKRTK